MSVDSVSYLVFVLVMWVVAIPARTPNVRKILLLVASYGFYATWGLDFLVLLIVSSLVNFAWAGGVRRRPTVGRLWIGVAFNVVLLTVFKYVPSIAGGLAADAPAAAFVRDIVMPVGLSFWTFQALSYLVDVYRGDDPEPSLLEFCLYMAFWPTVLSGPVSRVSEIVPQLRRIAPPTAQELSVATSRIVIGLVMKVVLADALAKGLSPGAGVSAGFDDVASGWGGLDVWMLGVGYGFQLFFDFAGYSHIVIGTARLFGISLPENFDHPFLSTRPSEFWTRWHMSLSFWIRDYVFFPLATSRREAWWRHAALVVAMTVFGLWHGAAATFVLWGMYHGLLLVGQRHVERLGRRLPALPTALLTGLGATVTFAAVSLGWILFRANGVGQASRMLAAVVSPAAYLTTTLPASYYVLVIVVTAGYFSCMAVGQVIGARLAAVRHA